MNHIIRAIIMSLLLFGCMSGKNSVHIADIDVSLTKLSDGYTATVTDASTGANISIPGIVFDKYGHVEYGQIKVLTPIGELKNDAE